MGRNAFPAPEGEPRLCRGGRRGASGKTCDSARVWRGPVCFALVQPGFAMAIVAVYKFRAKFRSMSDPTDTPPLVGLSREGLLLLRQDADVRSDADAIAACRSRDAFDAVIERYSPLDPAALDKPQNKDFAPLYEQALREGSALAYYGNTAPQSEAPVVTQWGFRPRGER